MPEEQRQPSRRGGTQQTNSGNFANDRDRASEAGRKGGRNSGGNFANDRARASEAGRKGGQRRQGPHEPPPQE
jgi:general stress protein YciG